jgi:hypothetical protein
MSLLTERVTITTAEYSLLKPGLDLLSCGLAGAKQGLLPHRYAFDRIDPAASSKFYPNKEYAPDMAGRIIAIRAKVWNMSQSRKLRFDVIDLAALQFALRLLKFTPIPRDSTTKSAVKELHRKLEVRRKRAQRAARNRIGKPELKIVQLRWARFVDWCRYYLLQTKAPKFTHSFGKTMWRGQRELLGIAINAALVENYYEPLAPEDLARIVALLKRSLRRGRHPVTLLELLKAPEQHTDVLLGFVQKRIQLTRTPGAPLPAWEAAMLRAEKFAAHQNRRANPNALTLAAPEPPAAPQSAPTAPEPALPPRRTDQTYPAVTAARSNLTVQERIEEIRRRLSLSGTNRHLSAQPTTAGPAQRRSGPAEEAMPNGAENPEPITRPQFQESLVRWFLNEMHWRDACAVFDQARSEIYRNIQYRHRKKTSHTKLADILDEFRPIGPPENEYFVVERYVGTLLSSMLAVCPEPAAIYHELTLAFPKARAIKEGRQM